jgi:uncharacterized coiled-coil protein SlyX
VDADGVALAAIQGLDQKLETRHSKSEAAIQGLQQEVQQKATEITELKQQNRSLAARLEALEKLIQRHTSN